MVLLFSNCLFAQTKIDSLEALLPNKLELEKVKVLNELAYAYWNVSADKGLNYAEMAYSIALKKESKTDIAKSLQNIGINHWAKSEFHIALEYFQKSLKIYEEIDDLKGTCSLYTRIGVVYKNLSDYENALKYYLHSLKISEENGFIDLYIKTIGNISSIYLIQQNYVKALGYVQEAIDLSEKQGDSSNMAAFLNTMGQIYDVQKNYKEAQATYKRALELNKKNRDNYGTTINLLNIGNTEYYLKNYASALVYFNESLILSTKINDQVGVLFANKSIGLVHKEQHRFDSALSYYKKSFDLAIELNLKEEKLDLFKNYADLYKSMGQYEKSLFYLENYLPLKDSIFNEKSSRQIAEMQTKYDSEQKEKENELLRKNSEIQKLEIAKQTNLRNSFIGVSFLIILMITILLNRFSIKKKANKLLILKNEVISNQRDELKEINSTKDRFFSIISHDLRSPFNSILGITDLLLNDYNNTDDTQRKELLSLLNESSQSAYELLDNLLTWARTQTGRIKISKEPLNLKELVTSSIAPYKYNASKKNIEIVINILPEIKLSIDRNTSIVFIGNLVNNAIKFTPEGGTITINNHEDKDDIKLHIIDTGVGMTSEVIGKLFKIEENTTTKGTNNEKGTGLGLILCKELINLNDGSILVLSKVGKGSEFIISLPKEENS